MRESLTLFAIAIILVLSALLVGPYLVDWNGQRDWLAAKLSDAVGAKVRIEGPIDVKLLPRPIFQAGQVSIAGHAPGEPRFSAERLDAELSINGLLQGAVEFVDATVASPRIQLTMRPDGAIVSTPLDVASPQKFQFKHITLNDGALLVVDEKGAELFALHGIAGEGEAETLLGPAKLSGSAHSRDSSNPITFRLNTGAYANRKLRLGLILDGAGTWTHAVLDGQVALAPIDGARGGAVSFAGNLALAGALRIAEGASPIPWTVAASGITADPQNLAAPTIELRAGADNRALVATGGVLASIGRTPAGIVKLHARQLNLDRITVPPDVAPDTPRPKPAQWFAAFRHILDGSLPFALTLDAGIDAVTTGDLTLTDAALTLDSRSGSRPHAAASIAGPDGTRIALDGILSTGSDPTFTGRADIATRDLATLAGWLDPFLPGSADWVSKGGLDGRAFAVKGGVNASSAAVSARDASFTLGGSIFTGTTSFKAATGTDRARFDADLQADALDPDQWPAWTTLRTLSDPLDLSIALRSDAVRLGRSDLASNPGRLALHLTKTGSVVALDTLNLSGFGGATVTAAASLDAEKRFRISGHAAAADVAPLASFMQQVLPGWPAEAMAGRARALSPVDASFTGDGSLSDATGFTPLSLTGEGTAAGTRFAVRITPQLRGGGGGLDAGLTLDAPEAAQVLTQAGFGVPGPLGALHAEAQGNGSLAEGFDATLKATVPSGKLSFNGHLTADGGQGRVVADGSDAGLLLRALNLGRTSASSAWSAASTVSWDEHTLGAQSIVTRIGGSQITGILSYARDAGTKTPAAPALTGALAIDSAAFGTLTGLALGPVTPAGPAQAAVWSSAAFGPVPAWPSSDIALKIGTVDLWPGLTARDAVGNLALRPGSLTLDGLSAHLLGGTAGGTLTLRRNGPGGSVTGRLSLDALRFDLPSLAGRLSGLLTFAGTGPSPAGLVGSLGGEGTLKTVGATTPRLDPAALGDAAKLFNRDDATIEDGAVREGLSRLLDRKALALGDLSGPATLAAGTLRIAGLKAGSPEANATSEAVLDLEALTLAFRTTLVATALPKDWKGDPPQVTVGWAGPLTGPARTIDVAAFVNGLAARAIQREQDRIELMKDDLRERAFFARRLRQIEAEQQAVRDAAQIQKMVPQPPRPGDIRLPRPPDVSPPALNPADPAPDPIKALIESSQRKPASRIPSKPVDLSPTGRQAPVPLPPVVSQDPGQEGRY